MAVRLMRRSLAITLATAGAISAQAQDVTTTSRTFVYKEAPRAKLEVVVTYPPGWKAEDRRPGIIFFFGGGWTNGNIKQFEAQAEHLARRGMVAARADYRVKSRHDVKPDACVEDARSAMRWFRAHAAEQGVDPDRIVAAGGSAGGHIAACTAFTTGLDAPGDDLKVSPRPNAMVLFNPVLRFSGVPQMMKRIDDDEKLGDAITPNLHVGKDAPPALILFGTDDKLAVMGDEYIKKAKDQGVRAELFSAPGQGHSFFNREPWKTRTTKAMDDFLTSLGYLPPPEKTSAK